MGQLLRLPSSSHHRKSFLIKLEPSVTCSTVGKGLALDPDGVWRCQEGGEALQGVDAHGQKSQLLPFPGAAAHHVPPILPLSCLPILHPSSTTSMLGHAILTWCPRVQVWTDCSYNATGPPWPAVLQLLPRPIELAASRWRFVTRPGWGQEPGSCCPLIRPEAALLG